MGQPESPPIETQRSPMPIIVGAPRSGTTLLRFMLDAHPELAIPPETGFLTIASRLHESGDRLRQRFFESIVTFPPDAPAWADFGVPESQFRSLLETIAPFSIAEGYRAFYRAYAGRFGKPRWGDKTPVYCLHLAAIDRILPEAHFIHLIRDGRDVALSLRDTWFSPGYDIEILAEYWTRFVKTARRQGAGCGHYLEVRFEDLVRDSQAVLRNLCRFLDLPFASEMLDYHRRTSDRLEEHRERRRTDGSLLVSRAERLQQQALTMEPPQQARVQAWRDRMTRDEQSRFEAIAGPLLRDLGYADPEATNN